MREYLRICRNEHGLTQEMTADKAGVSRAYYTRVEAGSRQKNMSLSMLEKLAKVFSVSVAELIEAEQQYRAGVSEKEAG